MQYFLCLFVFCTFFLPYVHYAQFSNVITVVVSATEIIIIRKKTVEETACTLDNNCNKITVLLIISVPKHVTVCRIASGGD